jgi:tripartite motif-containing protein 71
VNTNNTIYVINREENTILVWHEGSNNPTKIIRGDFKRPFSLFVTSNGDIYVGDGNNANGQVQRWIAETNTFVTVMNTKSTCNGLFVDINDTLYCSMFDHHQVLKRSLNDPVMTSNRVAAGTGIRGSDSNQFRNPYGIFVDVNLDLYVADSMNDRVQLFSSGESYGITVAGSQSPNPTITLDYPSVIVLDAEKYLFILDLVNHRIVRSGLNGFRCLIGCYGKGSQSNQWSDPFSFSFDRSGNMFVADSSNHRIQKFSLIKDSFGKLKRS